MARKKQSRKLRKVRRTLILLLILIIIFAVLSFITPTRSELDGGSGQTATIEDLELPSPIEGEQLIRHTGYTLSYNEEHELPSYVAYELTRAEVLGGGEREDSFKEDKAVRTGSAELSDYRGSGYDRGHQLPAADRYRSDAHRATYYPTNVTPQNSRMNQGIWQNLETTVRNWSDRCDTLYVVTGCVPSEDNFITDRGGNRVNVPDAYFKAVLKYDSHSSISEYMAIGIYVENRPYTENNINSSMVIRSSPAIAFSISISGCVFPVSQLETACLVTFKCSASSCWVICDSFRNFFRFFGISDITLPPYLLLL